MNRAGSPTDHESQVLHDKLEADRNKDTRIEELESANAALREEIKRNINEEPTDHLSCKEVCAEHPDEYDAEQTCPYCGDTFCPHCDPCLVRALADLAAAREKNERLKTELQASMQMYDDMGREKATLQRQISTTEKALEAVRRQERKATIALVHMSGKVSGDGPRAILDSIKVAEAELLKEESKARAILDGKGK